MNRELTDLDRPRWQQIAASSHSVPLDNPTAYNQAVLAFNARH